MQTRITVIGGISPKHEHGVEYDHADLLILTKLYGQDLGRGPLAFDAHHGGAISAGIAAHDFRGEAGEHLVLKFETEENRPTFVAVIGLGKPEDVSKRRICALFNLALNLAQSPEIQAKSMIFPVFPYRSSGTTLNLRATGAILRCILDQREQKGTLGVLEEVRVLCAPQARAHIESGLAIERTLCSQCRIPKLSPSCH